MAGHEHSGTEPESAAGRLALAVAAQHAALLERLREELGDDPVALSEAAQRLALEFGSVTAVTVEATLAGGAVTAGPVAPTPREVRLAPAPAPAEPEPAAETQPRELASLFRPGHMRRRLDQLIETNRRYGHPFGLAVFDASGPDTREASEQDTVLAIVGAALRDSIRLVDEAFRLEEDAICVLAPNLATVEGVQMAERLIGRLEELEKAGGMRISVAAGVVACPEHGANADNLLHKADAALWRARAVGQPVGVGALERVQDR